MSRSCRKGGFGKLGGLVAVLASIFLAAPASAELLCGEPIHEAPYDGCEVYQNRVRSQKICPENGAADWFVFHEGRRRP